jgi:hypothetical protein
LAKAYFGAIGNVNPGINTDYRALRPDGLGQHSGEVAGVAPNVEHAITGLRTTGDQELAV